MGALDNGVEDLECLSPESFCFLQKFLENRGCVDGPVICNQSIKKNVLADIREEGCEHGQLDICGIFISVNTDLRYSSGSGWRGSSWAFSDYEAVHIGQHEIPKKEPLLGAICCLFRICSSS